MTVAELETGVASNLNSARYVVYISESYVRDAQYFVPEHPIKFYCEEEEKMNGDNNWADSSKFGLFIGVFVWQKNDETGLKAYIAKKHELYEDSIVCLRIE